MCLLISDKLKDIIKKRIGIEQFEHKLEFISQHEAYTKTLKLATVAFKSLKPTDLLFDYEFARLFKTNESRRAEQWLKKNWLFLTHDYVHFKRLS